MAGKRPNNGATFTKGKISEMRKSKPLTEGQRQQRHRANASEQELKEGVRKESELRKQEFQKQFVEVMPGIKRLSLRDPSRGNLPEPTASVERREDQRLRNQRIARLLGSGGRRPNRK